MAKIDKNAKIELVTNAGETIDISGYTTSWNIERPADPEAGRMEPQEITVTFKVNWWGMFDLFHPPIWKLGDPETFDTT